MSSLSAGCPGRIVFFAVAPSPVNAILSTPGCFTIAAPAVPPHPGVGRAAYASLPAPSARPSAADTDLRLDLLPLADAVEPLPPEGASEAQVAAWVERYIDATVQLPGDPAYGR